MTNRPAFHIDLATCTGCKTCMIACKDKHDLPEGSKWRRVSEYAGGNWIAGEDGTYIQDVFAYYVSVSCNHCEDPLCVKACPTTAMHRDEQGIVSVDQSRCVGCRYCEWACPYHAPQFNIGLGTMTKCDFCRDLLTQGRDPACVAACPTRSLNWGQSDELKKRFGASPAIAPLPDPAITRPNLWVTPTQTTKAAGDKLGLIRNPEEV